MHRRNRSPRSRRGFVLLLVVMLLAVCCLVLVQLSLRFFGSINQHVVQQRELQEYWATVSIRRAVMPHAASIWEAHRQVDELQLTTVVQLSKQTYQLRLENENAKLNLTQAWRDFPAQARRDQIQSLLLSLDPSAFARFEALDGQADSWRDLVDELNHQTLSATDQITLWGDGTLDLTQVDEATLELAWKGLFGTFPPRELYAVKGQWPTPAWPQLRKQLGLREQQLQLADRWFSTTSRCYSLELSISSSLDRRREQSNVFITEPAGPSGFSY